MGNTLALSLLLISLISFQNCSKVDFGSSNQGVQSKSDDTNGLIPREDEVLDEVVSKNEACDPIFDGNNATDLQGGSSFFNGAKDHLLLKNGGHIVVNGTTNKLSIDGSKSASLNGSHRAVCIKSEFFLMNGSYGQSDVPNVLIGQGDNAILGVINGTRDSDLVLINIQDVGVLNGNNDNIYVNGGVVHIVNGTADSLHLMGGARVNYLNGNFGTVYLYGTSSIGTISGDSNIVKRK